MIKIENLILIGKFKIEQTTKILNRGFFIIGELIDGKISEENILDFNKIGINEIAIVQQIEEIRKVENKNSKNWIALKIECNNNKNMEFKINNQNSELIIDILEKNNNFG